MGACDGGRGRGAGRGVSLMLPEGWRMSYDRQQEVRSRASFGDVLVPARPGIQVWSINRITGASRLGIKRVN